MPELEALEHVLGNAQRELTIHRIGDDELAGIAPEPQHRGSSAACRRSIISSDAPVISIGVPSVAAARTAEKVGVVLRRDVDDRHGSFPLREHVRDRRECSVDLR